MSLVTRKKSIIPACDVTQIENFTEIIKQTHDLDCVGGYKIGFALGLGHSLTTITNIARKFTNKPLIYDHQKAGTDIPDTGKIFAKVLSEAGINAVILFPQAGPKTAEAWIKACQDQGITVIVGIIMTHDSYLYDFGGYLYTSKAMELFRKSAEWGVTNFVIPGNHVIYQGHISQTLLQGHNVSFFAPGAKKPSKYIDHYIVGRKIYQGKDNYRVNTLACKNMFL